MKHVKLQGCTTSGVYPFPHFCGVAVFFLALAQPTVNTNHLGKHFLSTRWPCKEPEKKRVSGGGGGKLAENSLGEVGGAKLFETHLN